MMQCFFNLRRGSQFIPDEDGIGVTDIDQTRFETESVIKELLTQNEENPFRWKGWRIEMVDSDGTILLALDLDSNSA